MTSATTSSVTLPMALWLACAIALLYACTALGSSDAPIPAAGTTLISDTNLEPVISIAAVPQRREQGSQQSDSQEVVAIVNKRKITSTELDASIRMQLYELDLARYELRLQRLKLLIVEQLFATGAASAENSAEDAYAAADKKILLQPPLAPRFEVDAGNNEIRGNPGAPVTIIEFLDFQSPHSSRVQPVLQQLLEEYGPVVRLIARDLPLHYHRHAKQAAAAAECARSQGSYWRYHDLLLQNQGNLVPSGFMHLASTLGLDLEQFQACLDDEKGETAVQEDAAAAQKLGLLSSPTFFINGLYLKGAKSYSRFARLINRELVRLGILDAEVIDNLGIEQSPFRAAPRSMLALALNGTVMRDNLFDSSAFLYDEAAGTTRTLKPGDMIFRDVELVLVDQDRAYFQYDGQLEYLPQSSSAGVASSEQGPGPSLPADAVLTLQRVEIERALKEIDKLEANLATGSMDLEGKRLLKLTKVEPGSFYDLLGLQEKDVLMQVDGMWVHNQQNPLWQALRTRNKLTLTIMRKGFPKTYRYVIKENRQ